MRSIVAFVVLVGILMAGSLVLGGVIGSDTPLKFVVPFVPAVIFWFCRQTVVRSLGF